MPPSRIASSLAAALARYPADARRAFPTYEADRRPNADAIADLAIDQFPGDAGPGRLAPVPARKAGRRLLHRLFPAWFIPLYTMISFTRIPYARRATAPAGSNEQSRA